MATDDEKDDKKDLVPDPDDREDFYSNMYRQPTAPAARPDLPLPPPPDVAAAGGEVLPQVQVPGSDTLANRLRAREQTLTEQLHPARKTGWGRVGQVLGTVGQDIATGLEPSVMAAIPGTTLNRRLELAGIRRELGEEQARESERTLHGAQAEEAQQRTEAARLAMGRPKGLSGEENIRTNQDTGAREQLYEFPSGERQWAPQDQPPTLPTTGARPTGATPGGMPMIQVPPPAPPPPTATGPAPTGAPPPVAAAPPTTPQFTYGKPAAGQVRLPDDQRNQLNTELADYYSRLNKGEKVPPEYQLKPGATKDDYDRVFAQLKGIETAAGLQQQRATTAELAKGNQEMRREEQQRQKEKASGEWLRAVDNDDKVHYVTRGDYDSRPRDFHPNPGNLPPGAYEKASDHATAINEMQGRMNAIAESAQKFPWGNSGQQNIVKQALQHVENSYVDKVIGIPVTDYVAQNLKQLGLQGAMPETREYIIDLISLREAMLAMPKEITGGSRSVEKAIDALYQGLPTGTTPDRTWAMHQLLAAQGILDRLRGTRVPIIDGMPRVEKVPDLFKYRGTNPQTKQRIYSDDKKNWVDEDGRPVR